MSNADVIINIEKQNDIEENDRQHESNTNQDQNRSSPQNKELDMEGLKIKSNNNDDISLSLKVQFSVVNKETILDLPQERCTHQKFGKNWWFAQRERFKKRFWKERTSENNIPRGIFGKAEWAQFSHGGMQRFPSPGPEGEPFVYEPRSRNDFIILVLCIVIVMLLITSIITVSIMTQKPLRRLFRKLGWMGYLAATIVLLIVHYSFMCLSCARKLPCSVVLITITVAATSVICGMLTIRFRTEIAIYAVAASCLIVLFCLILACSSFDLTSYMLYVFVIAMGFSIIAIIIMLTMKLTGNYMKPVHLTILIVSTLILIVTFIIELQTLLGGRSVELGTDDWALAAYLLYSSSVSIFRHLIKILGLLDDDD